MNKLLWISSLLLIMYSHYGFSQNNQFCESVTSTVRCSATQQFRFVHARCNNLNNPFFGAAQTKFLRMLPPRYADGVSSMPRSVTGAELPSTRLLSTRLFGSQSVPDTTLSLTAMNFAHFLTHDMSQSRANSVINGCCERRELVANPDRFCAAITVPSNDPIHRAGQCLNFNRNLFDTDLNCPNYQGDGFAQQVNRATAFLDLSTVYGNDNNELSRLRAFTNGQMIVETRNGATWPPPAPDRSICEVQSESEPCYHGDRRMNQTPHLAIISIMFLREHNRIAAQLRTLNPSWDDERLFQEARRINIAQYQYISYYEFLPKILGLDNMKAEKLYFFSSGGDFVNDYNATVDPSVINEFTGAAFRYFHTMIRGTLNLRSEQRTVTGSERLATVMDRPIFIEQGDNFDSFTRGMNTDGSESRDFNIDPEISTFFKARDRANGGDLKAIDIQRDRDQGIGSYNDFRVLAGLRRANSFSDLSDSVSSTNIANLQSVYAHVNDIDLSVGGDLENPKDNTVSHGATYHHIFMRQFRNTRVGDRYWFERSTSPYPFTTLQLNEIRKASLSRIICDNSNVQQVQPDSFVIPNSGNNAYVGCSSIPTVNLSLWKA